MLNQMSPENLRLACLTSESLNQLEDLLSQANALSSEIASIHEGPATSALPSETMTSETNGLEQCPKKP